MVNVYHWTNEYALPHTEYLLKLYYEGIDRIEFWRYLPKQYEKLPRYIFFCDNDYSRHLYNKTGEGDCQCYLIGFSRSIKKASPLMHVIPSTVCDTIYA